MYFQKFYLEQCILNIDLKADSFNYFFFNLKKRLNTYNRLLQFLFYIVAKSYLHHRARRFSHADDFFKSHREVLTVIGNSRDVGRE